jgi:hypothetical protein
MDFKHKIKILYFFKENDTFMWQWQRHYIFNDLLHNNIYIEILNPLHFPNYDEANKVLISKIKNDRYDLVMTTNNETVLYISTLLEIKKIGIPTLLFCPDSILIPFYYKDSCKYYDLVWITSQETTALYRSWGGNTIFLPFAANPRYYKPDFEHETKNICFVGTPHSNRTKLLNKLLSNNISTTVYTKVTNSKHKEGADFLYNGKLNSAVTMLKYNAGRKLLCGSILNKLKKSVVLNMDSSYLEILPPVSFQQLPVVYSQHALSLSTTAARHTAELRKPLDFILLRNFEIPMSGGLQICSYSKELSQYFEDEKEIIFYHDNIEFIDKVNFYLKPEKHTLRIKMKLAARKRAENEHTWFHRFEKIFIELGIKM